VERADFLTTDPRPLVEAALSCPRCLHAVDWCSAGLGTEPAVECRCRECGHVRTVALSAHQLLRLTAPEGEGGEQPLMLPGLGISMPYLFDL